MYVSISRFDSIKMSMPEIEMRWAEACNQEDVCPMLTREKQVFFTDFFLMEICLMESRFCNRKIFLWNILFTYPSADSNHKRMSVLC